MSQISPHGMEPNSSFIIFVNRLCDLQTRWTIADVDAGIPRICHIVEYFVETDTFNNVA